MIDEILELYLLAVGVGALWLWVEFARAPRMEEPEPPAKPTEKWAPRFPAKPLAVGGIIPPRPKAFVLPACIIQHQGPPIRGWRCMAETPEQWAATVAEWCA